MVDQSTWSHVTAFACWLLDHSEEVRNLMLSAGVVGAGIGVWIAFRRSQTDRLRQVTNSFQGAVELLGHKKPSVRSGAIYALERIARQNRHEQLADHGDVDGIRARPCSVTVRREGSAMV